MFLASKLRWRAVTALAAVFALHACASGPTETAPAPVQVMVFGVHHLQQAACDAAPAMSAVRSALGGYAPDHVVVEWLHPSIDPASTGNYRPLQNREQLATEWGYAADIPAALAEARANARGADAAARVELGKLYYLSGDRLNAGYQWWTAERLGADVSALRTATDERFAGHELEVLGFPLAHARGLEALTPFDYQGDDAAWIWDDIIMAVAVHAVQQVDGVSTDEAGFEAAAGGYFAAMQAHFQNGDAAWLERYGGVPEVREFAAVVTEWEAQRARSRERTSDACALEEIRRLQTPERVEEKRRLYYDVFPTLSLDGLGRQLVANYELRNSRMADFVEADVRRFNSRRVLIIVGEGHKLFLEAEFRRRGYEVVDPIGYLP